MNGLLADLDVLLDKDSYERELWQSPLRIAD